MFRGQKGKFSFIHFIRQLEVDFHRKKTDDSVSSFFVSHNEIWWIFHKEFGYFKKLQFHRFTVKNLLQRNS